MNRSWLWPFAVVVAFGDPPYPVAAQTIIKDDRVGHVSLFPRILDQRSQSHMPISVGPALGQLQDFLARRLSEARERSEGQKLIEEILKDPNKYLPPEQRKLLEQQLELARQQQPSSMAIGLDPNDPRVQEIIRQWVKNQDDLPARGPGASQIPLDPKQVAAIRKWLADLPKESPASPGGTPRTTGPLARPSPSPPPQPMPPQRLPIGFQPEPLTPPPQQKQAELFREIGELFGNSPTMRRLARDWARAGLNNRGTDAASDKSKSRLPRLGEYVRPERFLSASNGSLFPSLQKFRWPGSSAGARLPSVGAPHVGGPGAGNQSILPVVLAILLLLAGVCCWKLLRRRTNGGAKPDSPWSLGPWPVSPTAVTTRAELIQAFEYLALLVLGPKARHWNHREIAARLGESSARQSAERQLAADHLAGLYEHARYAPFSDSLPAEDIDSARRHLCVLAGVAA